MKVKNIELYKNGDNWVVAWEDNSSYYPEKSEKFPSKEQALKTATLLGARICRKCEDILRIEDDLVCGYHQLEN